MSRQELLEKSVNYLEKMTPERVEEVFHYIEYLYFRYETTIIKEGQPRTRFQKYLSQKIKIDNFKPLDRETLNGR